MTLEIFNRIVTLTPPVLLEVAWYNGALHFYGGVNFRFIHIEPAKPTP